jgi:hypothetical protein
MTSCARVGRHSTRAAKSGQTLRDRDADLAGTGLFFGVCGWLRGLALVLLSACMSGPERKAADLAGALPGHWTGTNQPASPFFGHWIDSFADLSLSVLIKESLAGNYDLKATAWTGSTTICKP